MTLRAGGRELIHFAVCTVALVVGVLVAVLAALIVSWIVAYLVTAGVTGWRDPGPDIIQGCEKSLFCSEGGTFIPVWGLAFLATVLIFRPVWNRLAPKQADGVGGGNRTG